MVLLVKIVLVGDGNVGRTTLRLKHLGKPVDTMHKSFIGAETSLLEYEFDKNIIRFQVWQLSEKQRHDAIRSVYYKGALGAILLFDVQREESFNNLNFWINEIWSNNDTGQIPIAIYGNVRDLTKVSVPYIRVLAYIEKLKEFQSVKVPIRYFEGSVLKGEKLDKILEFLAQEYLKIVEEQKNN